MQPEIVERDMLLLAGVTNCGKDVTDIDIHGLWEAYLHGESRIPNRVDGIWYELHVDAAEANGIYTVFIGAEIDDIGELPIDISVKTIPAGKYAHFVHKMADGGYDIAFKNVDIWVTASGYKTKGFGLQVYYSDFDPSNYDSELHILIPLA